MRRLLTIIFVFTVFTAKPCGWSPDDDEWYFYNLFSQTNISSEEFYPFLRDNLHSFYYVEGDNSSFTFDKGNIKLWKIILRDWKVDDIKKALFTDSDAKFQKLWTGKTSKLELSAKKYIKYARECSKLFEDRKEYSWNYDEILKTKSFNINTILQKGISFYVKEKNLQIKMRYAYQIIRAFHYSKKYYEAVDFFNQKIKSKYDKNEIYWYILDQVAGCYYSKGEFDKAAYAFLTVFNNSTDRKVSAFTSYNFCTNKGADGKSYFENNDDRATFILLKSIRSFSDEIKGLNDLYNLSPGDPKTELLFMRALNNIERNIWPKRTGMKDKVLPVITENQTEKIIKLDDFAKLMITNKNVRNKNFWRLSSSYLTFLKGNIQSAKQKLAQVTGNRFNKQKKSLLNIYKIFSWEKINEKNEQFLSTILNNIFNKESASYWGETAPAWKYLINDQAAHLYYKNGQIAKAFLMHNRIETVDRISSLKLINDLLVFVKKKNKNKFEELLMIRTSGIRNNSSAADYLYLVKGLYYLQEFKPKEAYSYLSKSSLNNIALSNQIENSSIESLVSARIFSNNIKECFSCSEQEVMVDSVFLASVFSFIIPKLTKAELAVNLIKLDSLTNDPKTWKKKLAHYLLGNYYYNISNSGYYRGTLSGQSHCCSYNYFFGTYRKQQLAEDLIQNNKGYNLFNIENYNKTYFCFANRAKEHYEKVISLSSDKELNARCLYLAAKCELNMMYNSDNFSCSGYNYYDGSVSGDNIEYKVSFEKLYNNYRDTKFYKMILKECSFFRIYCSL
ncbi:MAG: hypothetical protein K8R54_07095 [Bacteroidales bacterium]|nr:hypothetical protein [Bacteroidales bacterium]